MEKIREFDLNIEKILENWEVYHAIREIIANALDEQILTRTKNIDIYQDDSSWWHIKDYGHGLNYHHLTQNENDEKLNNDKLIGRFGVGLKDALATLYRHNIKVKIKSKYGDITLKTASKVGFEDIITLHAEILPPENENMIGTDFCLFGCAADDIEKAKSLFLSFTNDDILETTKYGQVIQKNGADSIIYINGVKVAQEDNFLFSYNITLLNSQIKKALNRERTNVGRSAYTSRIKDILLSCDSEDVIEELVDDLQYFTSGDKHDELSWNDVAIYASKKLSEIDSKTTFVTAQEMMEAPSIIDEMQRNGQNPIVVSDSLIIKMNKYNDTAENGNTLTTVRQYIEDEKSNFTPTVVDVSELTVDERNIYNKTSDILSLIGGKPEAVKDILLVEKIYEHGFYYEPLGLWIQEEGKILIKRNQLSCITDYAGTLLHECAHAISYADDVSRDFENELTKIIGKLASKIISKND